MKTSRALVLVGALIAIILASAFLIASAHPESGLTPEWRMWYSLIGQHGTLWGAIIGTAAVVIDDYEKRIVNLKRIYEDEEL